MSPKDDRPLQTYWAFWRSSIVATVRVFSFSTFYGNVAVVEYVERIWFSMDVYVDKNEDMDLSLAFLKTWDFMAICWYSMMYVFVFFILLTCVEFYDGCSGRHMIAVWLQHEVSYMTLIQRQINVLPSVAIIAVMKSGLVAFLKNQH